MMPGSDPDDQVRVLVGMYVDFVNFLPEERRQQHYREEQQLLDQVQRESDEAAQRQADRIERESFVLEKTSGVPSADDVFAHSAHQADRDDRRQAKAERKAAETDAEQDVPPPEYYEQELKRKRQKWREAFMRKARASREVEAASSAR
jgi:hypothetical protein